jgi:hypothetical protein
MVYFKPVTKSRSGFKVVRGRRYNYFWHYRWRSPYECDGMLQNHQQKQLMVEMNSKGKENRRVVKELALRKRQVWVSSTNKNKVL